MDGGSDLSRLTGQLLIHSLTHSLTPSPTQSEQMIVCVCVLCLGQRIEGCQYCPRGRYGDETGLTSAYCSSGLIVVAAVAVSFLV